MNPVETYLSELREIRSYNAHVEETSFYGALETLLNEIGKTLKPKVRCIINPKNVGAGIPDGGLFTPDQKNTDMIDGQTPNRGVVEVKGIRDEVSAVIASEQVRKYLQRYAQVLVTNYRDFALVGRDDAGSSITLESFRLAESADDFKAKLAHPRKLSGEIEAGFTEFLMRSLLRAADLSEPKDLAWLLASYARDARSKVEQAELPALDAVRTALEEALGLKFTGDDGEHFFRSTLVQTLFYGVFSAWVLWSKDTRNDDPDARFDWKNAAWKLHVPMIKALFEQIATPTQLKGLGVVEVLDSAGAALNRVKRGPFFEKFEEQHAVQYFYEPFLEAFDPELRKQLGVWYTPPEIVEYMVERVDTVLREELHIDGGLANPQVYVLDPACGTGAYLVEVLRRIEKTLRDEQGEDAVAGAMVKLAATERVFGFEILPAPFVVAHLQLGLMLKNIGAELSDDKNERARVYLTNSLTGWEPPSEEAKKELEQLGINFPQWKEEYDAAQQVKRQVPILVILGNPPYNAFAGVSPAEEENLVAPYKEGLISEWGIKKFNLDDLYVRFFRLAERRIAEMSGRGVVCYISNYSWLRDPSFVVLRKHLLESFDKFWIENMHGDRRITEYAPDGKTSETVFAIQGFSPGIQQGVAISLWLKNGTDAGHKPQVWFRDDLNAAKADERRKHLLASIEEDDLASHYQSANPTRDNRFSFRPAEVEGSYRSWPLVTDICAISPKNGLMEKRGGALISIDREALDARMQAYLNPSLDWSAFTALDLGLSEPQARFDPKAARRKMMEAESFYSDRIVRYAVRPYDTRWCYYTGIRPVWNEPRPSLYIQSWAGNRFLMTRPSGVASPEGVPFHMTGCLGDNDFLRGHAYYFPLQVRGGVSLQAPDRDALIRVLGRDPGELVPVGNLSKLAREYLDTLVVHDHDAENAGLIWMHALAIGYSPAYLKENADGIRQDWPRIPLPAKADALLSSAALGKQVAALLDTESPVAGVTALPLRPEMKVIGGIAHAEGGQLNPATDFAVTAGWGHAGQGGVTMPARGKAIERKYTPSERAAIVEGAQSLGITSAEAFAHLGETTFDIYLNDTAYWKNVPARVWDYHIGGYQVIKKWLSYREAKLLGRPLSLDEVKEVSNMARRISAITLLEPALDANYEAVKVATYTWP